MLQKYHNILQEVKSDILDKALIFGSIAGSMVYIVDFVTWKGGFELSLITDAIVVVFLILFTIFRKRISVTIKSVFVIVSIFVLVFVDILELGVLSANKVLFILLPFFAFISLSKKWTFIVFGMSLIGSIVLGYLHSTGLLSVTISEYIGFEAWFIHFTLICVVSFVVYLIIGKYNGAYEDMIGNLLAKNEEISLKEESLLEYKTKLEDLVEERTRALVSTNRKLTDKANVLRNALKNLNNAQERLLETEKMASLGLLATGVAHEINNPLNQIVGGVSLLEMKIRDRKEYEDDEEVFKLLEEVKMGVKRASKIVVNLNQYGPNHASMNDLCDIHDILKYSIALCERDIPKGIAIETELNASSYVMKGNIGKIHQVFINLIGNAGQAIKGEGKIKIITSNSADSLIINISDSGIGIAKEHLSKIYEPFFTTKAPGEGTGLGLYIVFGIVREHDGKLSVTSEVGMGTNIKLTFPL